jgi:predicted RNA-binding protein YlqC (UPF0109 family)
VLRHVVEHPQSVVVETSTSQQSTALEIVEPDGTTTIVTLQGRPELSR